MYQCKYCEHCKQIGRQQSNRYTDGRKHYYCKHPSAEGIKDKHGLSTTGFIGFGENTWESPLVMKTSPRWCPKKVK